MNMTILKPKWKRKVKMLVNVKFNSLGLTRGPA